MMFRTSSRSLARLASVAQRSFVMIMSSAVARTGLAVKHAHPLAPFEANGVVWVITAQEQLADEWSLSEGDEISRRAGDRFERRLWFKAQTVWQCRGQV